MTLFEQEWNAMANRTLESAKEAETSSVLKISAPPRPQAQRKESSITEKKGRSIGYRGIIAIIVVLTFINLLVFIGYIKVYGRKKESYNKINVGSAEYSDSDGQFMLRFDIGMILMATNDFSSENTLGQGGFGTVYKMISGERNNSFEGEGLAAFAWKRWVEGKPEIVIDPFLIENPRNEIIKLIQIGLLCVQENAAKRPTMSSVIIWLGSETIIIPLPKAPAFTGSQSQSENGIMSMSDDVFTELSCR
ncbi:unnamed protein product [Arabidopsis arenosa]|uniref:Uncharacterized protein n=1 Tax=Arabidopsis arenosa TaxID=38785 RepID=A0A8S2AMB9_ARAAE|nr:unnamed protein product [Arabidopsis arenosa]